MLGRVLMTNHFTNNSFSATVYYDLLYDTQQNVTAVLCNWNWATIFKAVSWEKRK